MDLAGGRAAFVLTALIVVGWFALGTLLNIRRGNRLLRWFQPGMTLLGERTTLRWLGSSGVELKVQHALPPLKSAEVFVLLEPRDLPLLWWLFRARGRRDLLIVRAELRTAPRFELEALHPRVDQARGCRASSSKRGAVRSSARTISRSRRPRARNNHHRRGRSRGSSSTKTSADLRGGSACCTFSSTPDDPSQRSVVRSPSSVIPGWNQRSNRLPR